MGQRLSKQLGLVALFLVLEISGGALLYWNHQDKQKDVLNGHMQVMRTAYTASVNMYSLAMDTLFSESINRPSVLGIVAAAGKSRGEKRDATRNQLLKLLTPTYEAMKQRNLRQLHFHLPDGTSLLRFHQIDKYGDRLFEARPSVRIANTERRFVHGFETGKVVSGFRYVFPLTDAGQHIGSVETSLSLAAILNAIAQVAPNSDYDFIIHKAAVSPKLFSGRLKVYGPSEMHPDFLVEDPQHQLADSPPPLSATARAIERRLRQDRVTQTAMSGAELFMTSAKIEGRDYAVSLLPIDDVERQFAGYLMAFTPSVTLGTLWREFYLSLAGLTLVLSLIFIQRI